MFKENRIVKLFIYIVVIKSTLLKTSLLHLLIRKLSKILLDSMVKICKNNGCRKGILYILNKIIKTNRTNNTFLNLIRDLYYEQSFITLKGACKIK